MTIDLDYKGLFIESALRPHLIVDDKIVVELKSAEQNHPVLKPKRVDLLINFGLPVLRQGMVRRVL